MTMKYRYDMAGKATPSWCLVVQCRQCVHVFSTPMFVILNTVASKRFTVCLQRVLYCGTSPEQTTRRTAQHIVQMLSDPAVSSRELFRATGRRFRRGIAAQRRMPIDKVSTVYTLTQKLLRQRTRASCLAVY